MGRTQIAALFISVVAIFWIVMDVSPVLLQPVLPCEDLDGADGALGYTDGDQGLAEICYLGICETEWGADGVSGYSENDVWFAAACYGGTRGAGIGVIDASEVEWSDGIFSMLTIMAGLVILTSGARLVYVDAQYEKIIDKHKDDIGDIEKDIVKELNEGDGVPGTTKDDTYLTNELANQRALLYNTEDRRDDNRRTGVVSDVIGVSGIIIFGFIASSGIFDDVAPMIVLSSVFVVAPVVHFLRHLRIVISGTRGKRQPVDVHH